MSDKILFDWAFGFTFWTTEVQIVIEGIHSPGAGCSRTEIHFDYFICKPRRNVVKIRLHQLNHMHVLKKHTQVIKSYQIKMKGKNSNVKFVNAFFLGEVIYQSIPLQFIKKRSHSIVSFATTLVLKKII